MKSIPSDSVGLKEYFDKQLAALAKNVDAQLASVTESALLRHEALTEATRVQAEVLNKKFEGVNEWRNTVVDITARLPPREELDTKLAAICQKIDLLEAFKNQVSGAPGDIKTLQALVDELKGWRNKQEGKASQSSVVISYLASFLAIILGLIALAKEFIK